MYIHHKAHFTTIKAYIICRDSYWCYCTYVFVDI